MVKIFSYFKSRTRGQRLQPERRSSFRIITLKNAGWLALTLAVLFLIFSAYMERRSRGTASYGRLYDRRIDAAHPPPAPPAPPEVVEEGPSQPVVRRDVLQNRQDDDLQDRNPSAETATTAAPAVRRPVRLRRSGERIVISGGTEGVRVDAHPAPATATVPPP